MTLSLFFSLRLCLKLLKRLLYSCQCLLTHVCLLCMSKVYRWKFFHYLCNFLQQFTWAYSSVKWVINSLISCTISLFLSSLTSSLTSFVCEIFLDWICQHWLSYNKLSSNNNNNNVSVVQICVSELTAHRVLILYDAYVVTLTLVTVDDNSVLFVDQQQLTWYAHLSQTMIILMLLNVNVLFVQLCITLNQMRTHQLSYINAILIQSQSVLISVSYTNCQKCGMTLFSKCHCTSEHFDKCCSNCKWCDHTAHCFIHNNDVLIVILNDENDDNVNESEHAAQSRQITLMLLMRTVVIYIDS